MDAWCNNQQLLRWLRSASPRRKAVISVRGTRAPCTRPPRQDFDCHGRVFHSFGSAPRRNIGGLELTTLEVERFPRKAALNMRKQRPAAGRLRSDAVDQPWGTTLPASAFICLTQRHCTSAKRYDGPAAHLIRRII